jgi:SOS-response transcriptional repressor LexA
MPPQIRLPLTKLQARVLSFAHEFILTKLYPPTVIEIQKGLDVSNPGTVHKVLISLQRKGYVTKEKGTARGLRIAPLGEEVCSQEKQMKLELEHYQPSQPITGTGGRNESSSGNPA